MRLDTAQLEQIRLSTLRHLDAAAATRFGLSTALLLQFIRSEGFAELQANILKAELRYLAEKGLIASQPKTLSPENEHWAITAAGRDFYSTATNG